MEMRNIHEILRSFRNDLPKDSRTAQAIDQGASLTEISEYAEEEGLHELASILFEAQQEELRDSSEPRQDLKSLAEGVIRNYRTNLPATSKTAQAIDRRATWEEISECAQEEGLNELASILFEAEQEKLRYKTAR